MANRKTLCRAPGCTVRSKRAYCFTHEKHQRARTPSTWPRGGAFTERMRRLYGVTKPDSRWSS